MNINSTFDDLLEGEGDGGHLENWFVHPSRQEGEPPHIRGELYKAKGKYDRKYGHRPGVLIKTSRIEQEDIDKGAKAGVVTTKKGSVFTLGKRSRVV